MEPYSVNETSTIMRNNKNTEHRKATAKKNANKSRPQQMEKTIRNKNFPEYSHVLESMNGSKFSNPDACLQKCSVSHSKRPCNELFSRSQQRKSIKRFQFGTFSASYAIHVLSGKKKHCAPNWSV